MEHRTHAVQGHPDAGAVAFADLGITGHKARTNGMPQI